MHKIHCSRLYQCAAIMLSQHGAVMICKFPAERARHSLAAAGAVSGTSLPDLERRIGAYNEAKAIIRNTLKASEGATLA